MTDEYDMVNVGSPKVIQHTIRFSKQAKLFLTFLSIGGKGQALPDFVDWLDRFVSDKGIKVGYSLQRMARKLCDRGFVNRRRCYPRIAIWTTASGLHYQYFLSDKGKRMLDSWIVEVKL
jgi:hypothetical protein